MKKSRKKLAIAAILAGSVMTSMASCQRNVAVYGPPPEDVSREADTGEDAAEASEDYDPDENMNVDVYGPPAEDNGEDF